MIDSGSRLMGVMIHDTDRPDAWERDGEDAMDIDILLSAMKH